MNRLHSLIIAVIAFFLVVVSEGNVKAQVGTLPATGAGEFLDPSELIAKMTKNALEESVANKMSATLAASGAINTSTTHDPLVYRVMKWLKDQKSYQIWQDAVSAAEELSTLESQLSAVWETKDMITKVYGTTKAAKINLETLNALYDAYSDYSVYADLVSSYYKDLFNNGEISFQELASLMSFLNSAGLMALQDILSCIDAFSVDGMSAKERYDYIRGKLKAIKMRNEFVANRTTEALTDKENQAMKDAVVLSMRTAYGNVPNVPGVTQKQAEKQLKNVLERKASNGGSTAESGIYLDSDQGAGLKNFAKNIKNAFSGWFGIVEACIFILAILLAVPVIIRTNSGEAQSANAMRKLVFVTIGFFLIIEVFKLILNWFVS